MFWGRQKQAARTISAMMLAIALSGCQAGKVYKAGNVLGERGDDYAAALKYIQALDINENHRKSRDALGAVAKDAYSQKLDLASEYEQQQAFAQALGQYQELKSFMERLHVEKMLNFAGIDAAAKIDEMESSAAQVEYAKAEGLLARGAWEKAVDAYRAAQSFKSHYKDSGEKTASAYYAWAEEDLSAKRWRDAGEHFHASTKAAHANYKDAAGRSASLFYALGTYFLGQDECRQATKDLKVAAGLSKSVQILPRLEEARSCAVTPVAILAMNNPTGRNVGGIAIGESLADQIAAGLDRGGSEFIELLDRSSMDAVAAERALSGGGTVKGARYLVAGKFSQVNVVSPGQSASNTSTQGSESYRCTKKDSEGKSYETNCKREATVTYILYQDQIRLDLSAALSVVDTKTGARLKSIALSQTASDAVEWAENFQLRGQQVAVVSMSKVGMGVGRDILKKRDAKRPLTGEAQLAAPLLTAMAAEATSQILSAIDNPPTPSDPMELSIESL
jgi:tetratricopeptide (TPR) repeat protein